MVRTSVEAMLHEYAPEYLLLSAQANQCLKTPGIGQGRRTQVRPVILRSVPTELIISRSRALLPEVVKFAYTPRIELRIHSDQRRGSVRREPSPDFSAFQTASASTSRVNDIDEDEHVLVLDFIDNAHGKKPTNPAFGYTLPPALTPAATKKLVERRNGRFVEAVNE